MLALAGAVAVLSGCCGAVDDTLHGILLTKACWSSLHVATRVLVSTSAIHAFGEFMRILVQAISVVTLLLTVGCGGGDGGSEPTTDCRNIGCVGDFSCQLNADDAYECCQVTGCGAAGEGGTAGAGGSAGAGGNEAGAAGSSGNERIAGEAVVLLEKAGTQGGVAGAGGNEAGAAGSGGISRCRNCIRMRTSEGRVQQAGIVGMFFTVDDCNGTPIVHPCGDDFEVYEDDNYCRCRSA